MDEDVWNKDLVDVRRRFQLNSDGEDDDDDFQDYVDMVYGIILGFTLY